MLGIFNSKQKKQVEEENNESRDLLLTQNWNEEVYPVEIDDAIEESIMETDIEEKIEEENSQTFTYQESPQQGKIYSTTVRVDSNIMVLLRKLERFPNKKEIQKKRTFFQTEVNRLENAKKALATLLTDPKQLNPSLVLAHTNIDSDLRNAIVEQNAFESKLDAEIKAIDELINMFESSEDYEKVVVLLELYGFKKENGKMLAHSSQIKPVKNTNGSQTTKESKSQSSKNSK